MNKYRNKEVTMYGIRFKSYKEAHYYTELLMRQKAGEIDEIVLQFVFHYQVKGKDSFKYLADFAYFDKVLNKQMYIDTKGFRTQTYILKKKIIEAHYKITITEV